jgi:transcriptional regulator with XRE-family HTH domain
MARTDRASAPQPPTLAGFLRAARRRRGLSREKLAFAASVSSSYIAQLESGEKGHPSALTLRSLAGPLALRPEELRHLFDLAKSPHDDDPGEPAETVDASITPEMQAAIDHLDPTLAGYVDRHWNVLATNTAYARAFPGLVDSGNVLRWLLTVHAAKNVMIEWEKETALTVDWFRGLAGTHGSDPWHQELLDELSDRPEFRQMWADHSVAFGRRSPYMHLRDPDTDEPYTVNVQLYPVSTDPRVPVQIYLGVRLPYRGP